MYRRLLKSTLSKEILNVQVYWISFCWSCNASAKAPKALVAVAQFYNVLCMHYTKHTTNDKITRERNKPTYLTGVAEI
jgi:hypothetical protein